MSLRALAASAARRELDRTDMLALLGDLLLRGPDYQVSKAALQHRFAVLDMDSVECERSKQQPVGIAADSATNQRRP